MNVVQMSRSLSCFLFMPQEFDGDVDGREFTFSCP
jgi:hypothetical protein